MSVVTRTIVPEDVEGWLRAINIGFLEVRDDVLAADADFRRSHSLLDYERTYGAFDEGHCIATFRSFATDLTMPGGITTVVSAVTAVTVSPTHRRRGILRELMANDLRRSVERGEPAAILIASEWPIYGRFGFGAATESVTYELDTTRATFPASSAPEHTFEIVSPAALIEIARPVFDRQRVGRPGFIDRNRPSWWEINFAVDVPPSHLHPWKGFAVVARDAAGDAQGYMRYHVDDRWDDRVCLSTLVIDELTAATDAATGDLWRFAAAVDLTVKVRAEGRAVDEFVGWELPDARAFRQLARADLLWVRPLDVRRFLEARRYFASDRLIIQVEDADGFADGCYDMQTSNDGATCRRTTRSPDLRMPVGVLGSIVLGGHNPVVLAAAGLIHEESSGAAVRAARLFWSPIAPWCNTWF